MGRPDYIFGQFQETVRCHDAQHWGGVCCAFAPQLVLLVYYSVASQSLLLTTTIRQSNPLQPTPAELFQASSAAIQSSTVPLASVSMNAAVSSVSLFSKVGVGNKISSSDACMHLHFKKGRKTQFSQTCWAYSVLVLVVVM